MSHGTKWLVFLERVLWTLLQVTTAEMIVQGYEGATGNELPAWWTVVLTVVLAALKNAFAQTFINPSGATLPEDKAPVVAEDVIAVRASDGASPVVVAGPGSPIETGTPVLVREAA